MSRSTFWRGAGASSGLGRKKDRAPGLGPEGLVRALTMTSEGGFIPLTALGSAPALPEPPVAEEVLVD